MEDEVTAHSLDNLRFEREMQWLNQHRAEYAGQWISLDGDHLISHSDNAREVFAAAELAGVRLPLVVRVGPPDELPFGGW